MRKLRLPLALESLAEAQPQIAGEIEDGDEAGARRVAAGSGSRKLSRTTCWGDS